MIKRAIISVILMVALGLAFQSPAVSIPQVVVCDQQGAVCSYPGGLLTMTGTITGVQATPWYALTGQSSCAVVLSGTGTGMTIIPQGASDQPPATPVTITTINSGSISSNGTYTGAVGAYALTGIRLNATGFTSGTENYTITCSNAIPPASVSGSVTAQISPIPLPVTVPTIAPGLAAPVAVLCPSTAPVPTNGAYSCVISSTGVLSVTTPAPVPTVSPGLLPAQVMACPSTEPGATNGAYTCVIQSDGTLKVATPAPAPTGTTGVVGVEPYGFTHLASPNPTSSPTSVKASAGTLGMVRFYNGSASTQFIGLYDLATSSVTLGTTVATEVLQCPATTYCFLPEPEGGITFTTAITYLCGTALSAGAVGTACGNNTSSFLMIDYHYAPWIFGHADTHLRIVPHRGLFDP